MYVIYGQHQHTGTKNHSSGINSHFYRFPTSNTSKAVKDNIIFTLLHLYPAEGYSDNIIQQNYQKTHLEVLLGQYT